MRLGCQTTVMIGMKSVKLLGTDLQLWKTHSQKHPYLLDFVHVGSVFVIFLPIQSITRRSPEQWSISAQPSLTFDGSKAAGHWSTLRSGLIDRSLKVKYILHHLEKKLLTVTSCLKTETDFRGQKSANLLLLKCIFILFCKGVSFALRLVI